MQECSTEIVAYFNDFDLWRNAILDLPDGAVVGQSLARSEVVDAVEIDSEPGNNINFPTLLTFPGSTTGLPLDFTLASVNANFTYNDTEFSSSYFPMLSPGDADNAENDDFEITITEVDTPLSVYAVGIRVGDNGVEPEEFLRVYGASDLLLEEFTSGLPDGSGYDFMGVVSAIPIYRVFFNEGAGGDDIVITDPSFGVAGGPGLYR